MTDTPIEFMAWDTRHNKLFHVEAVHQDQIDYINDLVTKFNAYLPKFGYQSRGEAILMQLTALRSTNNEPIYNHMIVKDNVGKYYLVDMFKYQLMACLSWVELEIVGNRFQRPDLLELCKN